MAPPAGYTAQELDFSDYFCGTTLNPVNWNTYITARHANGEPWDSTQLPPGGSAVNVASGSDQDYCLPSQISVNNGLNLTLQASSAVPGFTAVTGCVSSYGHFEFHSGYMQFLVKMPDVEHGGVPAIWFMEGPDGTTGNTGEIDLFEGGWLPTALGLPSSTPINDVVASHYDDTAGTWSGGGIDAGTDLSAGYNIYGVEYTPGSSINTYFNGKLIHSFTTNVNNQPYEVIINNSEVAGSSTTHSIGTEPYPTVMSIAAVQAYS